MTARWGHAIDRDTDRLWDPAVIERTRLRLEALAAERRGPLPRSLPDLELTLRPTWSQEMRRRAAELDADYAETLRARALELGANAAGDL